MKKTLSILMAVFILLGIAFCCPITSMASGEKITLISQTHGTIDSRKTKGFKLCVPAEAKVKIVFTGMYNGDNYDFFDYGTYGYVKIRIKDSNGDFIYNKETEIAYDDTVFNVTLEKGDYTLYFTENDDYEFEYYFKVIATLLEDVEITSLSLNKKNASLAVGKTLTLTKKFSPSIAPDNAVWTSSNKKVATVNTKGKVTAKALGVAKITVKFGGKTASCTVNVTANNNTIEVFVGKTASVKSRFSNVSGYGSAKYTSSDKKIATVNSSGVVTGKTTGNVTITATIKGVKYTQKVKVKKPGISLNKTSITIKEKNTYKLKATTSPSNVTVTWKSGKTSVAKVSSSGVVTGVKAGSAKITASFKYGGKTYTKTCTVTVKAISKAEKNYNTLKSYLKKYDSLGFVKNDDIQILAGMTLNDDGSVHFLYGEKWYDTWSTQIISDFDYKCGDKKVIEKFYFIQYDSSYTKRFATASATLPVSKFNENYQYTSSIDYRDSFIGSVDYVHDTHFDTVDWAFEYYDDILKDQFGFGLKGIGFSSYGK